MSRYALYFAPEPDSPWWLAGCQWLGRDAAAMRPLVQPSVPGISGAQMHALTMHARRYGFHATLKAPFHLAENCTVAQLDSALAAFCNGQAVFVLPSPQVQWMEGFLALRPQAACPDIGALARCCIRQFSQFGAPLSAAEITRRNKSTLSPRQQELLQRWGYPYTEEEFRFHLTLSDAQTDMGSTTSIRLHDAAQQHFNISATLRVTGIALFHEAAAGEDFKLLRRYRFGL
jgi:putative phosphonate metabolism protein